jgi:hypothetical protein
VWDERAERTGCAGHGLGGQGDDAHAAEGRAEPLPVPRRDLDERGGERRRRGAGGGALHDAAGHDPFDAGREEEHDVRRELDDQRTDQHRAPAEMVGQRAEREEGGEEADRVDGERQREQRRGELPLLAVDDQQRRQRPAAR